MAVEYHEPAKNSGEIRERARGLEMGAHHRRSETNNNVGMLINMLAHTMYNLADAIDRIAELEKRGPS